MRPALASLVLLVAACSGDVAPTGTTPDASTPAPDPADASTPASPDAAPVATPDAAPEPADPTVATSPAIPGSQFATWGLETLAAIDRDFKKADGLYRENTSSDATSFNWAAGTQLHALIAAGKLAEAEAYAARMHAVYWCNVNGRWAYNASAGGCGDRYYDDNAWVAKALMELFEKTGNATYLARAKETIAFSMSGENPPGAAPGGGIRWHEGDTSGQCLCATAPTLVADLMIRRAGGAESYLTDARRLYAWVKANRFGYGPGYRGYENAVMLQGALLLWKLTGDDAYLDDAHHIALAMESTYLDWTSHALRETGQWGGHDMTNAYVDLYEADKDVTWLNLVAGYLQFLHDRCKDGDGRYPETWTDAGVAGNPGLLFQAAAARAFARMGNSPGGSPKAKDPVALFQDCNYGGVTRAGLLIGRYRAADLQYRGLADKDLSSLRVASGYQVTLYKDDDFAGESLVRTADDGCLVGAGWNDVVRSLVVERVNPTAIVYKDCNFTGAARHLTTGTYDAARLRALGVSPDSISSLQVGPDYEVVLYAEETPGGAAPLVTGTASCLVAGGWNDRARSLVIRRKP
jgi:rhamnogalacturonyl hydrolase YesR